MGVRKNKGLLILRAICLNFTNSLLFFTKIVMMFSHPIRQVDVRNDVLTPYRTIGLEIFRCGYYINFGTENVIQLHILISKTYEKSIMGTNR